MGAFNTVQFARLLPPTSRRGNFHRLFNALLPADDPSHELGVPEYQESLVQ